MHCLFSILESEKDEKQDKLRLQLTMNCETGPDAGLFHLLINFSSLS